MNLVIASQGLRIWDLNSKKTVYTVARIDGNGQVIVDDLDGNKFAYLKCNGKKEQIIVKSIENDNVLSEVDVTDVECFRMTHGSQLIVSDRNGHLIKYDIGSKRSKILSHPYLPNLSIKNIHVSANHLALFSLYDNGIVSVINLQSRLQNKLDCQPVKLIEPCLWRPNELAMVMKNGSTVTTFDYEKQQQLNVFKFHRGSVSSLAYVVYNDSLIGSAGIDGKVIIFDPKDKRPQCVINVENPVVSLAFADGFELAVADSKNRIILYDIRSYKQPKFTFNEKTSIRSMRFNWTSRLKIHSSHSTTDICNTSSNLSSNSDIGNITDLKYEDSFFSQQDSCNGLMETQMDLSAFDTKNNQMTNCSISTFPRKQVQFDPSLTDDGNSDNKENKLPSSFDHSKSVTPPSESIYRNNPSLVQQSCHSAANVEPESSSLLQFPMLQRLIREELKSELEILRGRILFDVSNMVIDQLFETECKIKDCLSPLIAENLKLNDEILQLRQELRKYKYNI